MTTEFASFPASILLLLLILVFPLVLVFVVSRLSRKVKVGPALREDHLRDAKDRSREKEK